MLFSIRLERALRFAAVKHGGQTRKGTEIPYIEHLAGAAMVLDRLGFDEDVVIAGLLHDAVEDAGVSFEDIETRFGLRVRELVGHCTEVKSAPEVRKRPWIDRKTEHLEHVAKAPIEAKAVVLADKLHNLTSIATDLEDRVDVWSRFNATRDQAIWYYTSMIEACGGGDPRLERLAGDCRAVLAKIVAGNPAVDKI